MPTFAVTMAQGRRWDRLRGIREQEEWQEHANFADGLAASGDILFGGPIESDEPEIVALLAVSAADAQAAETIFDADPWVQSGILRIRRVKRWRLWLGGAVGSGPTGRALESDC